MAVKDTSDKPATNSEDTLRLSDVLESGDADARNLTSRLQFRYDQHSGDTTIEIKAADGDAPGQQIVLSGVDLTASGSLNDSQVIQILLAQGKLPTDH